MAELKKKIAFMQKYPNYNFTPHNFVSTTNAGEAVYEYIKDHNYEPSYYFERCESVLVNSIKMDLTRRGMDCEAMRLDEFTALFPDRD